MYQIFCRILMISSLITFYIECLLLFFLVVFLIKTVLDFTLNSIFIDCVITLKRGVELGFLYADSTLDSVRSPTFQEVSPKKSQ